MRGQSVSIAKVVPTAAAKKLGSLALGVEKGHPRRPVKLLDLSEPALIHGEEGDDASLYGLRVNQRTSVAVAGVQVQLITTRATAT